MENTLQFAELTTADLGNRDLARDNSKAGEQIMNINLSKIIIREGFNVRKDYGNLDDLAMSILENGQTLPGRVDILADGNFLLVDGHRRYKACLILADMGNEPIFKAIVNNSKTTEEQRIFQMFTTQDNKQLEPHEVAELILRLYNIGYNQITLAKKIGKSGAYISQMLSFANESPAIKDEVVNGHINVSTVLQLQKEIPVQSERVAAVKKAVTEKKETKSTKTVSVKAVTGKDAKQDKAEEMATAIAQMFDLAHTEFMPLTNLIKSYL